MVPAAISVIYCHLRWRDGSLWHWPLAHPTFFSQWRIMLIVTPLSATRIRLGGGGRRTGELQTLDGGGYTVFCLPLEARVLPAPVHARRNSLWETSSSLRPSVSFHMSQPKQTLHVAEGTFPAFPQLLGTWSIWLCGPSLQGWLNSGVCLFHSTSSRQIPNTNTHYS